jgi:hypothetical protein
MSTPIPAGNAGDLNPERLRLALIALSILAQEAIEKAQRANLDKAKIEHIHAQFDALKARVRELLFDWDKAVSTTIEEFRSPAFEHQAVRIRVQITDMEKPVQIEVPDEGEPDLMALLGSRPEDFGRGSTKTLRSVVTVAGDLDQVEELLPITDRQLIESLARERHGTATFEVLGIVVTPPAVEGPRGEAQIVQHYRILPVDIRPLKTALQIVAPTPGELQAVDGHYRKITAPLPYIVDKIAAYLGIQGLDRLTILNEALEFQVIAAVTEGQRASTAVVGPPGVGKNLIGKGAKLVQPVAREALPTKVTEAGLIGTGSSSAKRDSRRAGLLPQADQGVFIVQDWHQANSNKNQRLTSALATALQDGVVYDSSASRCSYRSEISLVIDANRQSDVRRTGQRADVDPLDQFVADTRLPINLLTRLTLIAEIPRGVEDQLRTMEQGLNSSGDDRQHIQATMAQEMRYIKVWLARVRDLHRTVVLLPAVVAHLKAMVLTAINVGGVRLEQRAEYGDFMVRLGEQAVMLTKAHARLHDRSVATLADVDGIYPYLHRKMSFIRSLLFGSDSLAVDVKATAPGRQTLMRLRLKPGRYTPKQVMRTLCLTSCSEEAISADLRALFGDEDEEGMYAVCA